MIFFHSSTSETNQNGKKPKQQNCPDRNGTRSRPKHNTLIPMTGARFHLPAQNTKTARIQTAPSKGEFPAEVFPGTNAAV